MIKRIAPFAAALALCLAAAAPAHAGSYIGVSAVQFDQKVTVPGASDHGHSNGFMIDLGSEFTPFLGLEFRFGGTNTAHFSKIAASQEVTLTSYLLRLNLPISYSLRLYGLGGLTTGRASPTGSLTGYANRQSTSYGGGLQMQGVHWAASVEWMRYWKNVNAGPGVNVTIDGLAGTLSYAF